MAPAHTDSKRLRKREQTAQPASGGPPRPESAQDVPTSWPWRPVATYAVASLSGSAPDASAVLEAHATWLVPIARVHEKVERRHGEHQAARHGQNQPKMVRPRGRGDQLRRTRWRASRGRHPTRRLWWSRLHRGSYRSYASVEEWHDGTASIRRLAKARINPRWSDLVAVATIGDVSGGEPLGVGTRRVGAVVESPAPWLVLIVRVRRRVARRYGEHQAARHGQNHPKMVRPRGRGDHWRRGRWRASRGRHPTRRRWWRRPQRGSYRSYASVEEWNDGTASLERLATDRISPRWFDLVAAATNFDVCCGKPLGVGTRRVGCGGVACTVARTDRTRP